MKINDVIISLKAVYNKSEVYFDRNNDKFIIIDKSGITEGYNKDDIYYNPFKYEKIDKVKSINERNTFEDFVKKLADNSFRGILLGCLGLLDSKSRVTVILEDLQLLDMWTEFRDRRDRIAAYEWCKSKNIVVEDYDISQETDNFKRGIYKHYKGTEYELICIAKNSENLKNMIVYRSVSNPDKIWVRPINMWDEIVQFNGKPCLRFQFLRDID